ncbi:VOC family protein [Ornithinimicrobium sp. F0845]|uniref:VOC family protein n=1 Tax=Ornithinimicrobium sp. F0845 TaxID=2926412 RepID=UPI001FF544D2|nr:VOC family protein [Ornithinimicrobium sp. F0845]MCK0113035.1 VOC family protein [Ornithinimicrobium sp. F0845]
MSDFRVRPKLVVDGADRAIEFYQEVLGATLVSRYAMGDAVVFAQLELPSGDVLQLKDPDDVDRGPTEGGAGVVMDIVCDDPDALVARAVELGSEVLFPVDDQPYGSRQGRIRDPFGHQWIAGTELTKTDEEVQAALDEWADAGAT